MVFPEIKILKEFNSCNATYLLFCLLGVVDEIKILNDNFVALLYLLPYFMVLFHYFAQLMLFSSGISDFLLRWIVTYE